MEEHLAERTVDLISSAYWRMLAGGISYDVEKDGTAEFLGLDYGSQVRFLLKDGKIYMENVIGIYTDKSVMPQFEGGGTITFEVEYREGQDGRFVLQNPVYTGFWQ